MEPALLAEVQGRAEDWGEVVVEADSQEVLVWGRGIFASVPILIAATKFLTREECLVIP